MALPGNGVTSDRSDSDILRFHAGLAALVEMHGNRIRRHKGSSCDIVDLVLLEEKLDALHRPCTASSLALSICGRFSLTPSTGSIHSLY
jgi:hypothetical protein